MLIRMRTHAHTIHNHGQMHSSTHNTHTHCVWQFNTQFACAFVAWHCDAPIRCGHAQLFGLARLEMRAQPNARRLDRKLQKRCATLIVCPAGPLSGSQHVDASRTYDACKYVNCLHRACAGRAIRTPHTMHTTGARANGTSILADNNYCAFRNVRGPLIDIRDLGH